MADTSKTFMDTSQINKVFSKILYVLVDTIFHAVPAIITYIFPQSQQCIGYIEVGLYAVILYKCIL